MANYDDSDRDTFGDRDQLPADLPPVEPPSAGFIVQLFVVPALIVMAIVGVWALFGKLAAGEQDWRALVAEVRNNNELRRWRGALGLAQMLRVDRQLGAAGQQLATNREIASELARMLDEQLRSNSRSEEDIQQQSFLTLAVGSLDVPDVILPVLQTAMQPGYDREIRKNAVGAVALIAGRAEERGESISGDPLVESLVSISTDDDALLRQMGAFALGLVPSDASEQRLLVLLGDPDRNARINAALGLARHDSTAGLSVFKDVLSELTAEDLVKAERSTISIPTATGVDAGSSSEVLMTVETVTTPTAAGVAKANAGQERTIAIKNVIKAVDSLADEFSAEERSELAALLKALSEGHPEKRIRIDATSALATLEKAK